MSPVVEPDAEDQRLAALHCYEILDTPPEGAYDDVTLLAARLCRAPMALVTFVDTERVWFKSRQGVDRCEVPREASFCGETVRHGDLHMVPDTTQLEASSRNLLVMEPDCVQFYAGAPLVTAEGHALGTVCVMDREPRVLDLEERKVLRALARQVMGLLELRLSLRHLSEQRSLLEEYRRHQEAYRQELESHNAILREESLMDGLTRLGSRRAFQHRLAEECERARRYAGRLSLLLMDVDRFDIYTDQFGHAAGDEVLGQVASLLEGCCRQCDFPARIGGSRFAVILPATDRNGATILGDRFREAVERAPWPNAAVTVSLGLATLAPDGDPPESLVSAAEAALLGGRRSGRGRPPDREQAPAA